LAFHALSSSTHAPSRARSAASPAQQGRFLPRHSAASRDHDSRSRRDALPFTRQPRLVVRDGPHTARHARYTIQHSRRSGDHLSCPNADVQSLGPTLRPSRLHFGALVRHVRRCRRYAARPGTHYPRPLDPALVSPLHARSSARTALLPIDYEQRRDQDPRISVDHVPRLVESPPSSTSHALCSTSHARNRVGHSRSSSATRQKRQIESVKTVVPPLGDKAGNVAAEAADETQKPLSAPQHRRSR
jgi:hypothetical protein